MDGLLETSKGVEGSEGNDELRDFFDTNSKLDLEWYNKLSEQDIDYDDLMESAEDDLRSMLKDDCQLKGKAVTRIINAVRKIPHSTIYKLTNAVKVSVISTEESTATSKIKKESARINKVIDNITDTIESLAANSRICENTINMNCDSMVKAINLRRNELLIQLKKVTDTKNNKLLNQQNTLTQKVKKIDEFYNKTQNTIKDTTMDPEKRKTKILNESQEILNNNKNDNELILATNDKIKIIMDMNKINEINDIISKIGDVMDGNGALPPSVEVKEIKHNAATIVIRENDEEKECIGHKLEYIQSDNGDIDDEKLEWKSITINTDNNNNKSIKYEIKSLHKGTKYRVRAISKNSNGFGIYSKCISFSTKDIDPKQIVADKLIFDSFGIDKSRMQIMNDQQVKCLKGFKMASNSGCYGSSIRFQCAMPIAARGNNEYNISSISWELSHTATVSFPNGYYFVGVVSNRTTNFKDIPYSGLLKDAYGISGRAGSVYAGSKINKNATNYIIQYEKNCALKIEYKINESILNFYSNNNKIYTTTLPTYINDITHWFPCIALRDKNDVCTISKNVTVI